MYDAAIGRFHVIDPLAEYDLKTSPYAYVGNNPLLYTDPTGMRRTKEERERARADRQAKRMAKRNKTKTIDAVSCTAKNKKEVWGQTQNYGETGYIPGQGPGLLPPKTKAKIWGGFWDWNGLANFKSKSRTRSLNKTKQDRFKSVADGIDKTVDIITSDEKIVNENTGNSPNPVEQEVNKRGGEGLVKMKAKEAQITSVKIDTVWELELSTTNKTDAIMPIDGEDFESGDSIFFYLSNPRGKSKVTKTRSK